MRWKTDRKAISSVQHTEPNLSLVNIRMGKEEKQETQLLSCSAVDVIADRTANDVRLRYASKLPNRFPLQVYERTFRFNGWSL